MIVDDYGCEVDTMECPCCGNVGATANLRDEYIDGQGLECGCSGNVSVDEDGAYISIHDCACEDSL